MVKILVTGGAGYIGSHTCKVLARHGFEPVVYDNLSRGNRWAAKFGMFEFGDIGDAAKVRSVLEKYRPSALIHFAAYAYVAESVANPLLYYSNNVGETASLLQTLIDFKSVPVVFSSSCATYGVPNRLPISEDHPQQPINPYGYSKLVVERMLGDLDAAHNLRSVSLRYFNVAGADPEAEIGEAHDPETHLIPLILAAARDATAVKVFGNDYDTADGTCVRDYVHVLDIADAQVRALKYLIGGGATCAVNLANERGYTVLEVVATAERVTGKSIQVELVPRRPGDPAVLIGAIEKARTLFGWKPERSDLGVQIRDAWRWMMRQS
ncbi:UDP-glucose 4-epimerase GalE [Bradyrhizobium sp. CCGUVB1N3]|uniref:UDP-glucose 4-epimerase GalE n=1 Tax=Bradyrhizobium sp. CCGUVB1N3 TaxID=2949629 RepID=UPI0020B326D6|nr:UDP-glucose 4-epimerase GalE [Bradyrhizobium sp. CCGUVB1N3]MCP3471637.1 UDP-glucose 4-epimerase GalE [Bradyrhizobium sp. CCGUVB1N3]